MSKIFQEKNGKKDLVVGSVQIESNMGPPSDIQLYLEAQLIGGTNESPGNWSECKPVIEAKSGFYVAEIDFIGLDHSKLTPYISK